MLRLLPALLLSLATGVPGAHTAVALDGAEEEAMTTVTLHVDTCPECIFSLIQSDAQGRSLYESEIVSPDGDGQVIFTVPTSNLRGVLIAATAPDNSTGLSQYVIPRFKGLRPGDEVSPRKARSSNRAAPCWAGTAKATVDLDVTVERRVGESDDQQVFYEMYTSTTQRWWGPMTDTAGASMEVFDVVPCEKKG